MKLFKTGNIFSKTFKIIKKKKPKGFVPAFLLFSTTSCEFSVGMTCMCMLDDIMKYFSLEHLTDRLKEQQINAVVYTYFVFEEMKENIIFPEIIGVFVRVN